MRIKCMLDTQEYENKPQGIEIAKITKRIKNYEIDIEDLINKIIKGCTFKPSYLEGTKEIDWKSQQLFALDFDENTTIQEELNRCKELNINPIFGYTSFSHKEEHHKFRLVFCFNKEITEYNIAHNIQLKLMELFNKCDEKCKNLSRLYFGGKELIINDYDNVLDYDMFVEIHNVDSMDIVNKTSKKESNKDNKYENKCGEERVDNILNDINNSPNILSTLSPSKDSTYNIEALRNRDIDFLKQSINNEPIIFDSKNEFWNYVFRLDMTKLLQISYPKAFKCIFHDDKNPSASIFKNDEGVYLYKCWGCNFTMNIKQVIEKLGNFKSEYKAIKFLKEIYNLSIAETEWSIEQKSNLESIIDGLSNNYFSEKCPQSNKNIRYIKDLFLTLLVIAKNNVYGENYCNSDGEVVFFVSLSELARIMKVSQNHIIRISQRLSVLAYHDLIRKLDDKCVPEVLLKKAMALSINSGVDKRINFYSIPSWVIDQLSYVENQALKWKSKGYTIKGTSYEMFYRGEGLETAQKIYPQFKKVKVETIDYETGEVKQEIKDRTTSKVSDERVYDIVQVMKDLTDKNKYTTDDLLILHLLQKYQYHITELQLKKMRGQIEKLGYKRIRCNKNIKEEYGIKSDGYPCIYVCV